MPFPPSGDGVFVLHLEIESVNAIAHRLIGLVGCTTTGGGQSPPPSSNESGSPSQPGSGAASASATPFSGPPTAVRLALDWTPNTNHTGFFVAQHEGWYAANGITLKVLPYTDTAPETLLAAHKADCGISFQDSLTFAAAAGADITSVMAILQHAASEIAVRADSSIQRPRDLDGKTYGGFGYPNEVPTVKFVIQHDGGRGDFKDVTINTAAYEALYSKKVDATITFTAWEGVEAKERAIDLRYFKFTDYGFPDFYQVVLACDRQFLEKEPDAARRFVSATVRGFELAASDPDTAAADLIAENPGAFESNPALPLDSARFLATGKFYVDASGKFGTQTLAQWQGYSGFLYDQGLLTDANGKKLSAPPDYSSLYTNDFLP
jgi:ABC-type nitrate/sulfonate/bicarbonate transport system substrate-binding protein